MKASMWGAVAVAILILLGAAAYAEETVPPGQASDADLFIVNRKSVENLYKRKEQRLKAVEAKKAADEEKQRKRRGRRKSIKFSGRPDALPRPGRS